MLENISKDKAIYARPLIALGLGMLTALVGIVTAMLLFPQAQGIASIAFTSMLLIPLLNKVHLIEEKADTKSKKFSLKKIITDHSRAFRIHFFIFMGMFLIYAYFSLFTKELLVKGVFDTQLDRIGVHGFAFNESFNFFSVFMNNLWVLVIFFGLALLFGAGSVLFLAWNASTWGVTMGYVASVFPDKFQALNTMLLKLLPHMVLEASAYLLAMIAGGILGEAMLRERMGGKKIGYIFKDGFAFMTFAVGMLIVASLIEVFLYPLL